MSEISELITVRDWVRWATSRFNEKELFYGHGTEAAWDEAVTLILHTLHLNHELYVNVIDTRLTKREKEHLIGLIEKRYLQRIPVPYLTQEAWFGGLSFYVDERVLIPRSPIAELIAGEFQPWLTTIPENILDLCTGSACIAIACALAFPAAKVSGSDISEDALEVAKINLAKHKVEDQVTLYCSDLFNDIPAQQFDLIISNPPYVDADDMAALPAEYLHEPPLALAAGQDGLDIVLRILKDAKKYLHPRGILIIEVGNSEEALTKRFPQTPLTWLEFENGGGGVFMLSAADLKNMVLE